MKQQIYNYVKTRVSERLADRSVPYAVYLKELTSHFGSESLPLIREMVKQKELFFQPTINTFVISTIPADDLWNHNITEHP
ncbi:MAG: hypothetical protein PHR19_08240 [Bacteroidales bacterium]|nr:hypothetical protein [Bacteroidales bacterium]